MPKESEVFVCPNPKCNSKIEEPVLLNNWAAAEEQYYACPHCFIKLDMEPANAEPQEKEEEKKEIEKPPVEPPEKREKDSSPCIHHFGYLANRPENTPVPQECLICSKVVGCMLKLSDT